jgi:preprotein translocase subunit SecD
MLEFPRWKTIAILCVTILVCLAAVPSALPSDLFAQLPTWAQRKFQLGYDLLGGERLQLVVDEKSVREMRLDWVRNDMRRLLREQRIPHTRVQIREDGVEVSIREAADMPHALEAVRYYTRPLVATAKPAPRIPADGRASVISDRSARIPLPDLDMSVADRVIRLTYTDAANIEHRKLATRASFEIVRRRLRDLKVPHEIHLVGNERIVVETAALGWRNVMH